MIFGSRIRAVSDLTTDGVINASDCTQFVNTYLLKRELEPINEMLSQYYESVDRKINEGIPVEDMNAATEDEVRDYIDSYTEKNEYYKFVIRKGVLYWLYDKTKSMPPALIQERDIDLLGDIYQDGKIDQKDIDRLQKYFNGEPGSAISDSNIPRCDLYEDGKIDEKDLKILEEMVN